MNALNANSLVVSTMAACVGFGCTNRDDKKSRQSGITFHVSWLSDLFKYRYFTILGMAIIEVTVDADHLTGQVSFNFPVVCKRVDVITSAKVLNIYIYVSYIFVLLTTYRDNTTNSC